MPPPTHTHTQLFPLGMTDAAGSPHQHSYTHTHTPPPTLALFLTHTLSLPSIGEQETDKLSFGSLNCCCV